MKIVFVVSTLKFSGAEKILYFLISELNNFHEISIIFTGENKKDHRFPDVIQYFVSASNFIKRRHLIRKILIMVRPEYVVSFNINTNIDLILSNFLLKGKTVVCERNDPHYYPSSYLRRARRDFIYNFADLYVFQTKEILSYFSKRIQKRSFIIPNFIEDLPNKPNFCTSDIPIRKAFGMFSRLDEKQKDISTAILAFVKFAESNSDYVLEIYGEGRDKEFYEKLISSFGAEDRIKLMGRVEASIPIMQSIDIFIITSKFEGMPNSLIEAMAIGKPCISSEFSGGGATFLIENDVNGLLFPVGDIDKLASLMSFIVENPIKKSELSINAKERAKSLSLANIFPLWEKIFIKNEANDVHG